MSKAFVQQLDADGLKFFNEVSKLTFSEQAIAVLNAFFDVKLEEQAEFIFSVSWEVIKKVDMRWRNVNYIHLYKEGNDLDFDMGLFFFESLIKFLEDPKNAKWADAKYAPSHPIDMTAIKRKQELRDSVDVNFDGRISFLEYLLYQYNLSPTDFVSRSNTTHEVNEALERAKLALEEVNARILAYETEKARLEELAAGTGVKALGAKNLLAQLHASPLADELRKALITAEAAVRIAARTGKTTTAAGGSASKTDGSIWWLQRDLKAKKEKYGK